MSEIVNTACGCDMTKFQDMRDASKERDQKMIASSLQNMSELESVRNDANVTKKKAFQHEERIDLVTRPFHYTGGRNYEPRKVIHDWELNFNLGNVVKYVSRAGRKDGEDALIDLHKARQYLEFEIEEIENARNS